MTEQAFERLTHQLRTGQSEGLQTVFRETHPYCVRTLVKKTACEWQDAEDIYMDSVLIFRENILSGKLSHLTNSKTYLFGICYNLWRDLNRAQQRHRKHQQEWERQLMIEWEGEWPAEEEKDTMLERLQVVQAALNDLGEKCRNLLSYVYIEQRSHKEVASLMGFANANVVKVTRHRCYQKWMKQIEKVQTVQYGE